MSLSLHYPAMAGGIESVTGSKTIDTGLRELHTFVCSLKAASTTANEEAVVMWAPAAAAVDTGSTRLVVLRVEKGGTGSGTIGDTAVDVSWFATGK